MFRDFYRPAPLLSTLKTCRATHVAVYANFSMEAKDFYVAVKDRQRRGTVGATATARSFHPCHFDSCVSKV